MKQKLVDFVLDFMYQLKNNWYNLKYWAKSKYRTTEQYHLIDTKLPPGYYDIDYRMLYGNFSLLVDFVEVELAAMARHCIDEYKNRKDKRSRELGMKYLDLCCKDGDSAPHYKDIRDLYIWWKDVRPNRVDPFAKFTSCKEYTKKDFTTAFKESEKQEKEDNTNLLKLIKLRKYFIYGHDMIKIDYNMLPKNCLSICGFEKTPK